MSDGTCITKILGTENGGYSPLTETECQTAKANGEIDVDACYTGVADYEYYAGAVKACGGKKNNLPDQTTLEKLAQELYPTATEIKGGTEITFATQDTAKAAPFLAQSPGQSEGWFYVWSSQEKDDTGAYCRAFFSKSTDYDWNGRDDRHIMAVCISTK